MEIRLSRECWPCRNRHVRCDQSRIPCAKCLKSGLDCSQERPIRWVKGVAIRGKMQGRAYEGPSVTKNTKKIVFKTPTTGPTTRPTAKVAKTNRDNPKRQRVKKLDDEHDPQCSKLPMLVLGGLSGQNVDSVTRYYLDYYQQICADFVASETETHLLKGLALLALNDLVLRNSLLALASRHIANRYHKPDGLGPAGLADDTDRVALLFKHRAIKELSSALRDPIALEKDTTVASVYIFILLDLLESGSSGWQEHLDGARALSRPIHPQEVITPVVAPQPPPQSQDIRIFLSQKLYLAESIGSVFARTQGTASLFPPITLDERDVARESMADSFLGCPGLLLRAIRFISTERDIIAAGLPHVKDQARSVHEARIVAMLDLVEGFDCSTSPFAQKGNVSSIQQGQKVQRRRVLSEVYKIGTLIYGKRVLATLLGAEITLDEDVSNLLELLDSLRGDRELLKCVLWPLFVAGIECRSTEQRQYFILHLEEFWMTTKCLNAVNAAKILQEHWQRGNTGTTSWPFDSGRFGRLWLLM